MRYSLKKKKIRHQAINLNTTEAWSSTARISSMIILGERTVSMKSGSISYEYDKGYVNEHAYVRSDYSILIN